MSQESSGKVPSFQKCTENSHFILFYFIFFSKLLLVFNELIPNSFGNVPSSKKDPFYFFGKLYQVGTHGTYVPKNFQKIPKFYKSSIWFLFEIIKKVPMEFMSQKSSWEFPNSKKCSERFHILFFPQCWKMLMEIMVKLNSAGTLHFFKIVICVHWSYIPKKSHVTVKVPFKSWYLSTFLDCFLEF